MTRRELTRLTTEEANMIDTFSDRLRSHLSQVSQLDHVLHEPVSCDNSGYPALNLPSPVEAAACHPCIQLNV